MKYTIDATNKKLGRIATEAAIYLMGKNTPAFVRNRVPTVEVSITNVSKMAITDKKYTTKEYKRFSGYPSGLKIETMKKIVTKKGYAEIMRLAIYNMLPSNKLRATMMKHLIITE